MFLFSFYLETCYDGKDPDITFLSPQTYHNRIRLHHDGVKGHTHHPAQRRSSFLFWTWRPRPFVRWNFRIYNYEVDSFYGTLSQVYIIALVKGSLRRITLNRVNPLNLLVYEGWSPFQRLWWQQGFKQPEGLDCASSDSFTNSSYQAGRNLGDVMFESLFMRFDRFIVETGSKEQCSVRTGQDR